MMSLNQRCTKHMIDEDLTLIVEKQTQQELEIYLDEVCRDNPSLRAEIDALLKAHYGQDDLLSGP